jgi:ATP-dependent Clp protease ATP-binding subunit ClpB
VGIQLRNLSKLLAQQEVQLSFTPALTEWLGELGWDPQFGARPLKRVIQRKVVNALSKHILAGTLDKSQPIVADKSPQGEVIFTNAVAV